MSFFDKLKQGLTKTRQNLVSKVEELVTGKKAIDENIYEELEDILIQADVGAEVSADLVDKLRQTAKERKIKDPAGLKPLLKEIIRETLEEGSNALNMEGPLTVILVIGVNGAGKTTTIGKLAHRFVQDGRKVIIAASDTFRAAAIDQLEILSSRVGAEVIKHQERSDPAAVAFDAMQAAKARKADILIVDTAGRLQHKKQPDGRTQKDRACTVPGSAGSASGGIACLGCNKRPECFNSGKSIRRDYGSNGNCADKTGQYCKGRHNHRNKRSFGHTGKIRRLRGKN